MTGSADELAKYEAFKNQEVSGEKVPPLVLEKFNELGGDVEAFENYMKEETDPGTLDTILTSIFEWLSR